MTDYKKLLNMIENVDKDDTATLDEIDARYYAYANLQGAKCTFNGTTIYYRYDHWPEDARTVLFHMFNNFQFTRSRDALKNERPEGWYAHNCVNLPETIGSIYECVLIKAKPYIEKISGLLPTEELAELHAIIQAKEWSRKND